MSSRSSDLSVTNSGVVSAVKSSGSSARFILNDRVEKAENVSRVDGYFQALFENAFDAFVVLGPAGQFLDANPVACELIGLARDELLGRNVTETIETTTNFAAAWNKFIRERTYRGQRWLVRPDGTRRLIEIRATANVLPGRHFAIWRDVTDRYFLDSELVQRERDQAITRVASGIAHDFTNLLHVIGGHAELVAREVMTDSELRTHIDRILTSTKQAAALTAQLSTLSRQQVLCPAVFDLDAFVRSCSETLHRLVPETVELVLPQIGQPAAVRADRTQMAQVLFMMTSTAGKLVPSGGRLTITAKNVDVKQDLVKPGLRVPAGEYVALELRTSPGECKESSQWHSMSAAVNTGAALPAVSATVKQNQGFLWITDDLTTGVIFSAYFPRAVGQALAMTDQEPIRNLSGNETILLVEDEPALREAAREYLKCLGYRVLHAADGEEAITAAQSADHIDALIADLRMPKVGGKELAQRLSATMPAIKIMFVSGNIDRELMQQEMEGDGPALLSKPFAMRTLASKLRDLLDGKITDDKPA